MKMLLPVSLLLIAACGRGDGEDGDGNATANQVARLSTPVDEKHDVLALVRLQPISAEELDREGLMGAGCTFSIGDNMLLAVVGGDAVVKIGGALRHLVPSAPAGPSGGFFEDRQLSVSVGRAGERAAVLDEGSGWPARLTVTNRRAEVEQDIAGVWACGA